jgi:hypothetical protein
MAVDTLLARQSLVADRHESAAITITAVSEADIRVDASALIWDVAVTLRFALEVWVFTDRWRLREVSTHVGAVRTRNGTLPGACFSRQVLRELRGQPVKVVLLLDQATTMGLQLRQD